MAKARSTFQCQQCGTRFPKWMGRCIECGEWNSVVEDLSAYGPGVVPLHGGAGFGGATFGGAGFGGAGLGGPGPVSVPLTEFPAETGQARLPTGLEEVERVLGGGLCPGSVTLLGGDPGIGKSTLVLQVLASLGAAGHACLYATGEESAGQIKSRALRLGLSGANVNLMAEVSLEVILAEVQRLAPAVLVVDSIQTVRSTELDSAAGNVSQMRACAEQLIRLAKLRDTAVILVGHVTKEGALAGPRTLEHMVDVVLYLEGQEERPQRLLRSVKNRFGPAHEIGLFSMTGQGMTPVTDAATLFLTQRGNGAPGTVVFLGVEGTRPLPVEIQALVGDSAAAYPRRTAVGLDSGRAGLLQAVIEKHLGDALGPLDVYLNVVGGLRLGEPALDAAVVAALLSSYRGRAIAADTVVFGEVGLTGELRAVPYTNERLAEAARLGFTRAIIPERVSGDAGAGAPGSSGASALKTVPVADVKRLAEALFE